MYPTTDSLTKTSPMMRPFTTLPCEAERLLLAQLLAYKEDLCFIERKASLFMFDSVEGVQ